MVLSLFAVPLFAGLVTLIVCASIYYAFLIPPSNFPKNIPTIPFYFTLLPLFRIVDQEELYHQYLAAPFKKYGAVKIFYGSRWNILLQRPEYLAEVFKYEDIYAKSGNQQKIPNSLLADYFGDNIISAHGENWRHYTSIMKPAILRDCETESVVRNTHILVDRLLEEQAKSQQKTVLLSPILERYALVNFSKSMFGMDSEALQRPDDRLHALQLAAKRETVKPIFLAFPFLDLLPIPSRQRARKLVVDFKTVLCDSVVQSHKHQHSHCSTENLGCSLVSAQESGALTQTQFRDNITVMYLAGHENPQLLLTSLIFLLGEHQDVQERLRQEILSMGTTELRYPELHDLPYLTSVIYETLRLFPPISQLMNRRTTEPVLLGGRIPIPTGAYVGYNGYAVGRDTKVWGEKADDFQPERWGSTMEEIGSLYRRVNSRASFIAFHGGRRACLGEKFAMLEARVALAVLVKGTKWRIDPTWTRHMTPGGPLAPRMLRLGFEQLEQRALIAEKS